MQQGSSTGFYKGVRRDSIRVQRGYHLKIIVQYERYTGFYEGSMREGYNMGSMGAL